MSKYLFAVVFLLVVASVHAATDEERLAQLGASMVDLTTADYQLSCGPANEIILGPISTPLIGDYYCIHIAGSTITYGTFVDASQTPTALLQVATDARFSAQLKQGDVKTDACNQLGIGKWERCSGAIKGLNTYILDDTLKSETVYLVVSTSAQDKLAQRGIITKVIDFFKGWFG